MVTLAIQTMTLRFWTPDSATGRTSFFSRTPNHLYLALLTYLSLRVAYIITSVVAVGVSTTTFATVACCGTVCAICFAPSRWSLSAPALPSYRQTPAYAYASAFASAYAVC